MDPRDALTLLSQALDEHGLGARGWTGGLDGAVRRFGACFYRKRKITLSRHLVTVNGEAEVLDTIRHEIAHALAWEEHGRHCGHDERWRRIATRIGATPRATVDPATAAGLTAPYALVHIETGEVFRHYHRRPRRDLRQSWIRGRKHETYGKLAIVTTRELDEKTGVPPEEADRQAFAQQASLFGLRAEDYGRQFTHDGRRYTLVELRPRNRRYPLIARDERGELYKFAPGVLGEA